MPFADYFSRVFKSRVIDLMIFGVCKRVILDYACFTSASGLVIYYVPTGFRACRRGLRLYVVPVQWG